MTSDFSISVNTDVIACDGSRSERTLLYEFEIKNQNLSTGGEFKLQITDPSDPGFLFDYKMTSSDFIVTKRELSLRCDFVGFSESLHKLLQFCTKKDNWTAIIDSKSEQNSIFYIEETTEINLVRPMKLKIIKASDSRLNEFLVNEVKKYKSLYVENEKKIVDIKSSVIKSTEQAQSKNQEIIKEYEQKIQILKEEKSNIIDEYESKMRLMKSQHNSEIKTIEEQYKKQYKDDTTKQITEINELKESNKQLQIEKMNYITKTETQAERIRILEDQNKEIRNDLLRKEEDGKQTTSTLVDTSKKEAALKLQNEHLKLENNQYREQIDILNKQIQRNDELINTLKVNVRNKLSEIEQLNESMKNYDKLVKENEYIKEKSKDVIQKLSIKSMNLENSIADTMEELECANEQIKEYKSKIYMANQTVIDYQKKNYDLEEENRRLQYECKDLERKLKASEDQINSLANQIDQQATVFLPKTTTSFLTSPKPTLTSFSPKKYFETSQTKDSELVEYEEDEIEEEEEEENNDVVFNSGKFQPIDILSDYRN